jgi:hypothetical protein
MRGKGSDPENLDRLLRSDGRQVRWKPAPGKSDRRIRKSAASPGRGSGCRQMAADFLFKDLSLFDCTPAVAGTIRSLVTGAQGSLSDLGSRTSHRVAAIHKLLLKMLS